MREAKVRPTGQGDRETKSLLMVIFETTCSISILEACTELPAAHVSLLVKLQDWHYCWFLFIGAEMKVRRG